MKQGMEWQVTSLEWSQKLKALNVKQESAFWWTYWLTDEQYRLEPQSEKEIATAPEAYENDVSAFTVAELGEMLPDIFASGSVHFHNKPRSYKCWDDHDGAGIELTQYADTEADCRAKMLCYLLENNLITTSENH